MSDELVGRWRRVLDDLLSLEVSTIVKHSMTATKFPDPVNALIDVGLDYWRELHSIAPWDTPLPSAWGLEELDALRTRASTLARRFQGRPERAAGIELPAQPIQEKDMPTFIMLCRIRDNCDQLKGLFGGTSAKLTRSDTTKLELDDRQKLLLRKIWEIGTEQVVMQTTVYLDGDVITHIRPDHARPEASRIPEIHRQAVDASVAFWSKLVDVLGAFVKSAADILGGR